MHTEEDPRYYLRMICREATLHAIISPENPKQAQFPHHHFTDEIHQMILG
jgi:hypothetical protein